LNVRLCSDPSEHQKDILIMNKHRYSLPKALALSLAASIGIALSGCGESTTTSSTTAMSDSTRGADTTKVVASRTYTATDMGLTLPVMDALFYEEGFEQELKTKLQLTDAQVTKLKTVSHESVAELTEDGLGDYSGSSRSAIQRSEEQIRSILGEEKATQLYQLVGQRYASGDVEGLMPTKPNAVPTDTRIVVNSPAYRVDVFQEGKLLKTYKVGIGYPEFPLPTGMRRAETIIFNPTWTPPDEPWVKGKFKPGEKVEAGSKDNPLGPLKIPIGLPSLIHGGKAVAKLGNFASHGCVGMTNDQVRDFANVLAQLSGSSLTPDQIQGYGKNRTETKSVKLERPVPVELRYETIVGEPGALRIYRDVYERGTNTVDNARRVLEVYGVSYESLSPQEKTSLTDALVAMNKDPQGKPIVDNVGGTDTASTAGTKTGESKDGVAASKLDRAKKGKETRTIVGQKEIAVPIAALAGKGYPAPANLNSGTNKPDTALTASATRPR
jgi:lipoprotein-anchoring transpeptidase ErfK/SrfK